MHDDDRAPAPAFTAADRFAHRRPPIVLAAVDGGPGTRAVLRAAAQIAQSRGGSVLAAHVTRPPMSFLPEAGFLPDESTPEDVAVALFPTIVESLYDTTVRCELVALVGDAGTELAALARRRTVDAVVLGASPRRAFGGLRRLISGSVPHRLRDLQDAPVITVPTLVPAC